MSRKKTGCKLRVSSCKLRDKIQGKMREKNRLQVASFKLRVKRWNTGKTVGQSIQSFGHPVGQSTGHPGLPRRYAPRNDNISPPP